MVNPIKLVFGGDTGEKGNVAEPFPDCVIRDVFYLDVWFCDAKYCAD